MASLSTPGSERRAHSGASVSRVLAWRQLRRRQHVTPARELILCGRLPQHSCTRSANSITSEASAGGRCSPAAAGDAGGAVEGGALVAEGRAVGKYHSGFLDLLLGCARRGGLAPKYSGEGHPREGTIKVLLGGKFMLKMSLKKQPRDSPGLLGSTKVYKGHSDLS